MRRKQPRSRRSCAAFSVASCRTRCADLREGVRRALAAFTTALLDSEPRRHAADALESAYDEALTAVYRLLFLFFAEARGLVPSWHPVYRDAYGMESMRAAAEVDVRGLWPTFQAISRLAHTGCRAGDLEVTAFNGRLLQRQLELCQTHWARFSSWLSSWLVGALFPRLQRSRRVVHLRRPNPG